MEPRDLLRVTYRANSWSFDSTVGDDPQLIIGAGEGDGVAWGKGRLSTVKGRE